MKKGVCIALVASQFVTGAGLPAQGPAGGPAAPILSGFPYRILTVPQLKAAEGAPGTIFMEEELSYGWTGHVVGDVRNTAMFGTMKFKSPALKAGQAVYGIPMQMQGFAGASLFWCAPIPDKNGWRTTCVNSGGKVTYSAFRNGLTVTAFNGNTAQGSEAITVQPEAAPELPRPIRITHSVTQWHKSYVDFATVISVDGRADGKGIVTKIGRGADGTVRFSVGGGIIRLSEKAEGGFAATVERPFVPGGNALIDYWDR